MTKRYFKKILIILMIALFSAYNFFPKQIILAQQAESRLGPENFRDTINDIGTNIVIIDNYANNIKEKQIPQLNALKSVSDSLKKDITKNMHDAKNNANHWFNQLKPDIRNSIEQIITFNDIFQSRYQYILKAIEQKDNKKLNLEIEQLCKEISENKQKVDALVKDLTAFRNNLNKDITSFQNNANQLQVKMSMSNADIPLIKEQIDYYNRIIKTANKKIVGGSVLCCAGILCIAGGPLIKEGKEEKEDAEYQISMLERKISDIEKEFVVLTDIENKFTNMADMIGKAIDSLQHISNHWHVMGAKYNNLLKHTKNMKVEELQLLEEELHIAKTNWEELKRFAEKFNQGLKQNDIIDRAKDYNH
ncbi:hypothetical protein CAI16_04040 [Virgibacillus dokdonensis]|uniref:Hemolysin BL-binding component n=1 Tax=Virgibacillus dokdonensis TaxID=302167 RepID=A0A3E0WX22_9BACI|nr:HBL/NHE enterotoxin family protein [Virgibacillus dokdonensis]RFA36566.1 hypothetical protein CAI16_04040 [Virgibacillus dokdonensis]